MPSYSLKRLSEATGQRFTRWKQVESALMEDTVPEWTVTHLAPGYRVDGPYEDGMHVALTIFGETNRTLSPDFRYVDPPLVWDEAIGDDWQPSEPPIRWEVVVSNYPRGQSNKPADYAETVHTGEISG